jgi:hypothetical protein
MASILFNSPIPTPKGTEFAILADSGGTPLSDANFAKGQYETVAASQTAQVIGATGATGDFIAGLLVIPATVGCGAVTLLDNATSISVFVGGGTTALPSCIPFFIPLGMQSVSGAWKVTTGANVSVIAIGNFT